MIYLYYDNDPEHAWSDQRAFQLTLNSTYQSSEVVVTSTENVIQAFRSLVSKGVIDPSNIVIHHGDTEIRIDKFGALSPKDRYFNNFHYNLSVEIITKAFVDRGNERLAQPNEQKPQDWSLDQGVAK